MRNTTTTISLLAAVLLVLAPPLLPATKGQSRAAGARDTQSPPQQPAGTPVALAAEPVSVGNLGLQLYLPEGASVQTDEIPGGKVKMIIQPREPKWVMQVYNTRSSNHDLTPEEALDAIVAQRLTSGPTVQHPETRKLVSLYAEVQRVNDLRIKTRGDADSGRIPASRSYLRRRFDGDVINYPPAGYTVMRTAPGHFITIQLDCLEADFDEARQIYETVIASARIADPDRQARVRSMALAAGERFLENITRDDLDELLGAEPRWFRIYEPNASGSPGDAKEIGYQRVEVRLGQLGELDLSKSRIEYSPQERAYGYLVILEARTLDTPLASAPQGRAVSYSDLGARFFLSRDREEEFWNINVDYTDNGERKRVFQNLVRRGDRVTVNTRPFGQPRETADYSVLGDHYLSAVERILLPRLVTEFARGDEGALFNLGFYTFDSTRAAITFRSERFERTPGGGWQQSTIPFQGALPWTTTLDKDGRIITQVIPPARTIEPIELKELHRLWKSKGLPTG